MTEDAKIENDDVIPVTHAMKSKDATVTYRASIANLGTGVSITLFLSGVVVTGNLISGKQYYESIASDIKGSGGESAEIIAKYFSEVGEAVYGLNDEADAPPTNFIHLNEVSLLKGDGNMFNFSNGLLRVKIEEIDGIIIGRLGNKS